MDAHTRCSAGSKRRRFSRSLKVGMMITILTEWCFLESRLWHADWYDGWEFNDLDLF